MRLESLTNNVIKAMERYTKKLQKQYGGEIQVWLQANRIHSLLGNMFGVTLGGVIKGLTTLVEQGAVVKEMRGGKAVFCLPHND